MTPPSAKSPQTKSKKRAKRTAKTKTPRKKQTSAKTDPPKPESTDPWQPLGFSEDLLKALQKAEFEKPTDIQTALIPEILAGNDCLGQAKTGTGKTAAFALPMLQIVKPGQGTQALVLVPTRELAAQVDEHVRMLSPRNTPLKTALVYGGRRIASQIKTLREKPEIVVGTPGRVLDLLGRRELKFDNICLAVLDEVDRMLDIGFRDDIRRILRQIKKEHQTVFVSATITDEIRTLAGSFTTDAIEINVSRDEITVDEIDQTYVSVQREGKFATLLGYLREEDPELAIVFTNTKHAARRVAERLKQKGFKCKEIHGDLVQARRERVMTSFRKAQIQVLVATDLAARGLDVMKVSHIVNYDLPPDPSVYVHRIGRTARMGKRGDAIAFVCPDEGSLLTEIEKLINKEIVKLEAPWVVKPEKAPVPEVSDEPAEPAVAERYTQTNRRSEVLESYGIKPVRRTLGSRFPSKRRRR